ncbi:hypothetical protein [Nonomuraea antimicrobica]|uniref:hypothetical protein n=1 Tax=Nonomuraea antimicrobica TaxID=561173 RepID=UPI0031EDAE39
MDGRSSLSAVCAIVLAIGLAAQPVHAQDSVFYYRTADATAWTEINGPNEQCYDLDVNANLIHNKTPYKATLYKTYACNEDYLQTSLIPGERWDGGLKSAKSVRFEFS